MDPFPAEVCADGVERPTAFARRPVLVIQNDIGNEKAATTIMAAISTSLKIYPMNVRIDPPEGGLKKSSVMEILSAP